MQLARVPGCRCMGARHTWEAACMHAGKEGAAQGGVGPRGLCMLHMVNRGSIWG